MAPVNCCATRRAELAAPRPIRIVLPGAPAAAISLAYPPYRLLRTILSGRGGSAIKICP
jgi:hypothetical protein